MSRTPTIVVIDYHKGNLSSVARGLARAGAQALITDDPGQILEADGLVLPGVGSFYDAIVFMHETGQDEAIARAVRSNADAEVGTGVPFLGICLGLQLLFERGDEGVPNETKAESAADAYGTGLAAGTVFEAEGVRWVRGLGLLHGSCTRLPERRLKVPHVGWDQAHLTDAGERCPLLQGFDEGANVYFTHSYALAPDTDQTCIQANTFYGRAFGSVIQHGTIFGCQFHPEKSSGHGATILKNFVALCAQTKEERA